MYCNRYFEGNRQMKIRIFSDIHNEIRRYYKYDQWFPSQLDTDKDTVLILAGDVDTAKQIPTYLNFLAKRFKAVIHIAGNHEYYGSSLFDSARHMTTNLAPNVYHLQNQTVTIDGQRFVGCTMWTNFSGFQLEASLRMNDFRKIRIGGPKGYRRINSADIMRLNAESKLFLADSITEDSIVITHHQPFSPPPPTPYGHTASVPLDYAYYACFDKEIEEFWRPKLWVAGHTHESGEAKCGRTKLLVNCVGYPGEYSDFDKESLHDV